MRGLLTISLLTLAFLAGCTRPSQPGIGCEWHEYQGEKRPHREDAEIAEDTAIRYADAHAGLRTGRYEGPELYVATREKCMEVLFAAIAKNHGVPLEKVRQASFERPVLFNACVILAFTLLYGLVAIVIARMVRRRVELEDGVSIVMTVSLIASLLVSGAGAMAGDIWSISAETYRLGNGHLSYRTNQVPWIRCRLWFFFGGLAIYWLIAWYYYREKRI